MFTLKRHKVWKPLFLMLIFFSFSISLVNGFDYSINNTFYRNFIDSESSWLSDIDNLYSINDEWYNNILSYECLQGCNNWTNSVFDGLPRGLIDSSRQLDLNGYYPNVGSIYGYFEDINVNSHIGRINLNEEKIFVLNNNTFFAIATPDTDNSILFRNFTVKLCLQNSCTPIFYMKDYYISGSSADFGYSILRSNQETEIIYFDNIVFEILSRAEEGGDHDNRGGIVEFFIMNSTFSNYDNELPTLSLNVSKTNICFNVTSQEAVFNFDIIAEDNDDDLIYYSISDYSIENIDVILYEDFKVYDSDDVGYWDIDDSFCYSDYFYSQHTCSRNALFEDYIKIGLDDNEPVMFVEQGLDFWLFPNYLLKKITFESRLKFKYTDSSVVFKYMDSTFNQITELNITLNNTHVLMYNSTNLIGSMLNDGTYFYHRTYYNSTNDAINFILENTENNEDIVYQTNYSNLWGIYVNVTGKDPGTFYKNHVIFDYFKWSLLSTSIVDSWTTIPPTSISTDVKGTNKFIISVTDDFHLNLGKNIYEFDYYTDELFCLEVKESDLDNLVDNNFLFVIPNGNKIYNIVFYSAMFILIIILLMQFNSIAISFIITGTCLLLVAYLIDKDATKLISSGSLIAFGVSILFAKI